MMLASCSSEIGAILVAEVGGVGVVLVDVVGESAVEVRKWEMLEVVVT